MSVLSDIRDLLQGERQYRHIRDTGPINLGLTTQGTLYTNMDVVGAAPLILPRMSQAPGSGGLIRQITLTNEDPTVNANLILVFYLLPPTTAADNVAFAPTDEEVRAGYIGRTGVLQTNALTFVNNRAGEFASTAATTGLPYVTGDDRRLYCIPLVSSGYTQGAGTDLWLRFLYQWV